MEPRLVRSRDVERWGSRGVRRELGILKSDGARTSWELGDKVWNERD